MSKNNFFIEISSHANKNPKKAAISDINGILAYYQDFVNIYASCKDILASYKISSIDRVGILSRKGISYGLLGLPLMENATLIPLDNDWNKERYVEYYKLLKFDYLMTDLSEGAAFEGALDEGLGIVKFCISGNPGNITLSSELYKKPTIHYKEKKDRNSDICYLDTTSGTTSIPKIVPSSYKSCLEGASQMKNVFHFDENDVALIITRMSRSQSINTLIRSLYFGGSCVILNGFNHTDVINVLNRDGITWFTASPAVLGSFSDYLKRTGLQLSKNNLRFVRSSGAPLTKNLKDHLEDIFGVPVIQTYGMTEAKMISSTYHAIQGYKEGSAGISAGTDIKVLNDEILVKGDCVFKGYEDNPEANVASFIDGWFRTGDMGYIDEDGYIFITGRIKEMINRGGEKISPYEVEASILSIKGINHAAVFPYPNNNGSENAGAAIVLDKNYNINLKKLRKTLSKKLSYYKMPTLLYIVDEIPISKNGKVQRKTLYNFLSENYVGKEDYMDDEVESQEDFIPNDIQSELINIWKEILNKKHISINDNFFEIGGDSLAAAALFSYIEDGFGIQVPMNIFFKESTIKSLAIYIESSEKIKESLRFLVPVKASGYKEPLICVHTGDGEAVTYHHIGKFMEETRPVYALRFDESSSLWQHPLTFRQIGEKYAKEIRRLDPYGPYHLCGTCFGGVLAFEIASILKKQGANVKTLAMFDSVYNIGGRKYSKLFFNSFDEIRSKGIKQLIPLTLKKTNTMINLIKTKYKKNIYKESIKEQNNLQNKNLGKAALLSYAHSIYTPEKYDGKIYYFSSKKDKSRGVTAETYWSTMSDNFHIIPMDCRHTEINDEFNSKFLAEKLSLIMEDTNV